MKIQLSQHAKLFFLTFLIAGFAFSFLGLGRAHAAKPPNPGGYMDLCTGSGATTVNGETLSLTSKIRKGVEAGKDPLRNEFSSTLGSSSFPRLVAPAAGYLLNSITIRVNSNSDCTPSGNDFATFHFTGTGSPIDVDSDDNDGDALKMADILPSAETVFNGLKVPLGYSGVAFPTGSNEELVEAVCTFIKDEIAAGNTLAATEAATIGSMYGAQGPALMRCLYSQTWVHWVNADASPSTCGPDDFAGSIFLSIMAGAPAANITVTSDGFGNYTVTNNDNGTSASASINGDGSCEVSEGDFEL